MESKLEKVWSLVAVLIIYFSVFSMAVGHVEGRSEDQIIAEDGDVGEKIEDSDSFGFIEPSEGGTVDSTISTTVETEWKESDYSRLRFNIDSDLHGTLNTWEDTTADYTYDDVDPGDRILKVELLQYYPEEGWGVLYEDEINVTIDIFDMEISNIDDEVVEGGDIMVDNEATYAGVEKETKDIELNIDEEVEDSEEVTSQGKDDYDSLWEHEEHDGTVWSVDHAEIGGKEVVFSGSSDDTLVAYDYEEEEKLWEHEEHDGTVRSVDHAEIDGKEVVFSGSYDETVVAYDYDEEEKLWQHEEHDCRVYSVDHAEIDGREVVFSGSTDDTVIAYDYEEEMKLWQHEEHDGWVHSIDHAEIGGKEVVFSGSSDDTLVAYDYEEEEKLWEHEEHDGWVFSIDHAEIDGREVVFSGSTDDTVIAYDYEEEMKLWQHEEHDGTVRSVDHVEIDGREVVLSGSTDDTVIAYDYDEDKKLWEHEEHDYSVYSVDYAEIDGREVVFSGSSDNTVVAVEYLVDEYFEVEITEYDDEVVEGGDITVDYEATYAGAEEETQEIEFKIDEEVEDSEEVTLERKDDYESLWEHGVHDSTVYSVDHAEIDGREVVFSGSTDRTVVAYDYEEEKKLWEHDEHGGRVFSIDHAEIEGREVVFSGSTDDTVVAYDYDEEEKLWGHEAHDEVVCSVDHAEIDGREVVFSGSYDETVVAYDYDEEEKLWQHEEHDCRVWSVDHAEIGGKEVVFSGSSDDTLVAYDYEEEEKLWQHEEHDCRVYSVDHAEIDGKEVVFSGSNDDTVVAYDYDEEEKLWRHDEHDGTVRSVDHAEIDGKDVVFSGLDDDTVVAYDYDEEEKLWRHDEHDGSVRSVDYAEIDGREVVFSGSSDGTVSAAQYLMEERVNEGEFTWETEKGDAGERDLVIESEDDEDTITVDVLEEAFFTVEIDETASDTETIEGEDLTVTAEITNSGEETEEQEIELYDFTGEKVDSQAVELGDRGYKEIDLIWSTELGDAGEGQISVETEDSSEDMDVWIKEQADFDVDIVETDSPIVEGEDLTVTAEITNSGEETEEQEIELYDINGMEVDSTTVTLGASEPGEEESTEVGLIWSTDDGDAGEGKIEVQTQDSNADMDVWIKEQADFDVDIVETDSPIVEGEDLTVTAKITNSGEETEEQEVELYDFTGGKVDSQSVELGDGGYTEIDLIWSTEVGDAGEGKIEVETEDSSADQEIWIKEQADFEVDIYKTTGPVVEGDDLIVTSNVSNVGEAECEQEIKLHNFTENEVDSVNVELEGSDETTVDFTWSTEVGDADTDKIEVQTQDGSSDEQKVWIKEQANFVVQIFSPEDDKRFVEGENVSVHYQVSNTGEELDEQDIGFYVDSDLIEVKKDLELKGGDTYQGNFSWKAEKPYGERDISVQTEDHNDAVSIDVLEEAFFDVEINDPEDDLEFVEGEEIHVEYVVNNTGDVEATQSITFSVFEEGEEAVHQDIEDNVTLSPEEVQSGSFSWQTIEGESGDYLLEVSSDDRSEYSMIKVLEKASFDISGVNHEDEIREGETFHFNYSISNSGEVNDTQFIRLEVQEGDGKTVYEEEVSLNLKGGETWHQGVFRWKTEIGVSGTYSLNLSTEDDHHLSELNVSRLEPHFLSVESTMENITAGSSFEIEVRSFTEDGHPTPKKELCDLTVSSERDGVLFDESVVELDRDGNHTLKVTEDKLLTAERQTITVGAQDVQEAYLEIQVAPAEVERIDIGYEEEKEVFSGEKLEFKAVSYDRYDNLITDVQSDFEWSGANSTGIFEKETAGRYEVSAGLYGEISPVKEVTVRPEGSVETVDVTDTKNITLELEASDGVDQVLIGQEKNLTDGERFEYLDSIEYELKDRHGLQDLFIKYLVEDEIVSERYHTEVFYDLAEVKLDYIGLETVIFEENLEYELDWVNEGEKEISSYELRAGPSPEEMDELVSGHRNTNHTYELEENDTVYFELIGHHEYLGEDHVLSFNVTTELIDTETRKREISEDEFESFKIDIPEDRRDDISVRWYVEEELREEGLLYEPDLEPGEHIVIAELVDESSDVETEIPYIVEVKESDQSSGGTIIAEDHFLRMDGIYQYLVIGIPIVAVILVAAVLTSKSKSKRTGVKVNKKDEEDFSSEDKSKTSKHNQKNMNGVSNDVSVECTEEQVLKIFKELKKADKADAHKQLEEKMDVSKLNYQSFEEHVEELVRKEKIIRQPRRNTEDEYIFRGG